MKIYKVYYSHYCECTDSMWYGSEKYFSDKDRACAHKESLRENYKTLRTESERSTFRTHIVEIEVEE